MTSLEFFLQKKRGGGGNKDGVPNVVNDIA